MNKNGIQKAARMLAERKGQFDKAEPSKVQRVVLVLKTGDTTRPFMARVVGENHYIAGFSQ